MAFIGIPAIGHDAGVGKPTGATNLVTNGGFETDTTGWITFQITITRNTGDASSGSACATVEFTSTSGAAFYDHTISGSTAGLEFAGQLWVKGVDTGIGKSVSLALRELGGATATRTLDATPVTLTGDWQRVTASGTVAQNDRTTIRVEAASSGSWVSGEQFLIDGVQLETGPVATPYIETDGSAASRAPMKWVA